MIAIKTPFTKPAHCRGVIKGIMSVLSRRAFNRNLFAMGSLLAMGASLAAHAEEQPVFTSSIKACCVMPVNWKKS